MKKYFVNTLVVFSLILLIGCSSKPVTAQMKSDTNVVQSAETIVEGLYNLVTWEPGKIADWDKVKNLFQENAIVALRRTRTQMITINKQGFVDLFIADVNRMNLQERGFSEKIIKKKLTLLGDVAYCTVLYEVSIPSIPNSAQRGVDHFHLLKKDGRWWITSIINEIPREGVPVPEEVRE